MKKFFLLLFCQFFPILLFAKRFGGPKSYQLGTLPSGEEVGKSLLFAIPLLIIGFLIARAGDPKKISILGFGSGCLMMIVGAFLLIPLLVYVELVFDSVLGIIFLIAVPILVIYAIYSWLKKK